MFTLIRQIYLTFLRQRVLTRDILLYALTSGNIV